MLPWIALISASKYLNESYADIRDRWSLGEIVDHIHIHRGFAAQEEHAHKAANAKTSRLRK